MKRLIFLFQPGCPSCEAMHPELKRLRAERKDVEVIAFDLTTTVWPEWLNWAPTATPTFILQRKGRPIVAGEGKTSYENLVRWIDS